MPQLIRMAQLSTAALPTLYAMIFALLLLTNTASCLAVSSEHPFSLSQPQPFFVPLHPTRPTRITLTCFWGQPSIQVFINNQFQWQKRVEGFLEFQLPLSTVGVLVELVIKGPGVGIVRGQAIEQFQMLRWGALQIVRVRRGEKRVFEVHPEKRGQLLIEKIEGIPLFQVSKCKPEEKIDCLNRMQRTPPIKMQSNLENVTLQPCTHCIMILLVRSEQLASIRINMQANITVLANRPSLALLHAGQSVVFLLYLPPLSEAKIFRFSGDVQLSVNSSSALVKYLDNGYQVLVPKEHKLSDPVGIRVLGKTESSWFSVQSVSSTDKLRLVDGLPTTIRLEPLQNYTLLFDGQSSSVGNFHLSSIPAFMATLTLRFTDIQTANTYVVRPKYVFQTESASQNFQLANFTHVSVTVSTSSNEPGFLNLSANAQERLMLPLGWTHSAVLKHSQSHGYLFGQDSQVEVVIRKCVECPLVVRLSSLKGEIQSVAVEGREYRRTVQNYRDQLFIDIETNHYAFYSIVIQHRDQNPREQLPSLKNITIQAYLTEPENSLQLEFQPPRCGHAPCQRPKYYIVQGSDHRHVSSRAYCPNSLFDFDERTKDITVETIQPQATHTDTVTLQRPLWRRDWLVVAVEVKGMILSYSVVNVGEMREYSNMRWPLFYLVMFVTLAIVLSLVAVGLGRKRHTGGGYIRASSQCSAESLS